MNESEMEVCIDTLEALAQVTANVRAAQIRIGALEALAQVAANVRVAQKRCFKQRSSDHLIKSKAHERELDRLLATLNIQPEADA